MAEVSKKIFCIKISFYIFKIIEKQFWNVDFFNHLCILGRNCYMLASRQLQKGLEHVTKNRELSRKDFRELCDLRIEAGAKDLHYDPFYMRDTLARLHIGLNTKVLANLAIWEPRSFRSIVGLCAHKESKFDEPQKEIKSGSALSCDYPDKRGPYVPGPGTKVIDRGLL